MKKERKYEQMYELDKKIFENAQKTYKECENLKNKYKNLEAFLEDIENIPGFDKKSFAVERIELDDERLEFKWQGYSWKKEEKRRKLGPFYPSKNNPNYQKVYGVFRRHEKYYGRKVWNTIDELVADLPKIEGYDLKKFIEDEIILRPKDKTRPFGKRNCIFVVKTDEIQERRKKKKEEKKKIIDTRRQKYIFVSQTGRVVDWEGTLKEFADEIGTSRENLSSAVSPRMKKSAKGWRIFTKEEWKIVKDYYGTPYFHEVETLYTYLKRQHFLNRKNGKNEFTWEFVDFLTKLPSVENFNMEKFLEGSTRLVIKEGKKKWNVKNCIFDDSLKRKHYSRD